MFWIIHDPGSQKRITLSLESISTIPFQASATDVKIPEWGQYCSHCKMACLISNFLSIRGTADQPNKSPAPLIWCTADIYSNITDREILWPGILVTRKFHQVDLVRRTNNWHNCPSSRKLILCIPPPIARVHLAEYSANFGVCKVHQFQIKVYLK